MNREATGSVLKHLQCVVALPSLQQFFVDSIFQGYSHFHWQVETIWQVLHSESQNCTLQQKKVTKNDFSTLKHVLNTILTLHFLILFSLFLFLSNTVPDKYVFHLLENVKWWELKNVVGLEGFWALERRFQTCWTQRFHAFRFVTKRFKSPVVFGVLLWKNRLFPSFALYLHSVISLHLNTHLALKRQLNVPCTFSCCEHWMLFLCMCIFLAVSGGFGGHLAGAMTAHNSSAALSGGGGWPSGDGDAYMAGLSTSHPVQMQGQPGPLTGAGCPPAAPAPFPGAFAPPQPGSSSTAFLPAPPVTATPPVHFARPPLPAPSHFST